MVGETATGTARWVFFLPLFYGYVVRNRGLFYGYVVRNRRFPARFFGSWRTRLNAQNTLLCISWPDFFTSAFSCLRL